VTSPNLKTIFETHDVHISPTHNIHTHLLEMMLGDQIKVISVEIRHIYCVKELRLRKEVNCNRNSVDSRQGN
jgi:hypothetical protein